MALPPPGPYFGSMNFLSGMETLCAPISANQVHISFNCDVIFVVSAPAHFVQVPSEPDVALYLDLHEHEARALPANGYQVTCPEPLSKHQFLIWADRTTQMIRDALMITGLCGVDTADLRNMLQACHSRRLVSHIFDYDDVNQPPLSKLETLRFNNIFACLFADQTISLANYSEIGVALEEINPHADQIKLCANIHAESSTRLLLLGEPS